MDLQSHIHQIRQLDDDGLLRSLKRHVGSSNRLTAVVLAHLAEVDARGAYRQWACDTLAAYCVYELRLSEDEAQRRCRVARVARQFPVLFEMLADASIHLTGVLLLAPHLTAENHREVLARARYRRKREIELLVAELAPARDIPALIEPLAARAAAPLRGGWAAVAESHAGWFRELTPGDAPTRAPNAPDAWHEELLGELGAEEVSAPARQEVGPQTPTANAAEPARDGPYPANSVTPALDAPPAETPTAPATAPVNGAPHGTSARYRVQFTADQAYVDALEQARALLWHRLPSGDLAQLHRLALEALLEKLVRRKYGAGARSGRLETRRSHSSTAAGSHRHGAPAAEAPSPPSETESSLAERSAEEGWGGTETSVGTETSIVIGSETVNGVRDGAEPPDATAALARHGAPSSNERSRPDHEHLAAPRRSNSRHVPTAVRSAVWLRDEGRCTFVDTRGVRCRATTALELHHEQPFARGGPATLENIRLRCRAHNELAAEQDFGRKPLLARRHGRTRPDMPVR